MRSHHPHQRLSLRSWPPLRQGIQHHHRHQRQVLTSGSIQTWLCPRIHQNALSPLWQIHGHASHQCPRSDTHFHWQMAVTRVNGLHPAADLVLQHRGLCQDDPATLVSAPLSTLLSNTSIIHPIFTHNPIPDPSGGPSGTPSITAQPIFHLMAREHHSHSFQPNLLQHH